MSTIEKLITKALTDPQNLTFRDFCNLCEHFGMAKRKSKSSHVIYKRSENPKFTLPIQDDNGSAKSYQVKQLFDKLRELGLYDSEEKK